MKYCGVCRIEHDVMKWCVYRGVNIDMWRFPYKHGELNIIHRKLSGLFEYEFWFNEEMNK